MAVVVNKDNPVENVTSAHLAKNSSRGNQEVARRQEHRPRPPQRFPGETETLQHLNKLSAAEWRTVLATHKDSILLVDTDADVLKAVQAEPGAIGLVEEHSLDSSIHVVTVDGKLPMESGYLPH
jgi:hypothetical protein